MIIGKPKPRTASTSKPTGRPVHSDRAAKPSPPATAAPRKPAVVPPVTASSAKPGTSSPARQTPTLDFPGRTSLYPHECARAVGCHTDHVLDLVSEGILKGVDISGGGNKTDRRCIRIPVEAWRAFLSKRSTC